MSIVDGDIVLYSSQNMPQNDTDISGGDINSGISVVFTDIVSIDVVQVSGAAADSGTLTVTGRQSDGAIVSESISLSGLTIVNGFQSFERILSVTNTEPASGTITVRDSGTVTTIGSINSGESGFLRPFYNATANAAGGSDKLLYEKVFLMNTNTGTALLNTTVSGVNSGIYTKMTYAVDTGVQINESVSNRLTVPTKTGPYGSGSSGIPNNDLSPLSYVGIWLRLDLNAGDAAQNSYYQLQVDGSTV